MGWTKSSHFSSSLIFSLCRWIASWCLLISDSCAWISSVWLFFNFFNCSCCCCLKNWSSWAFSFFPKAPPASLTAPEIQKEQWIVMSFSQMGWSVKELTFGSTCIVAHHSYDCSWILKDFPSWWNTLQWGHSDKMRLNSYFQTFSHHSWFGGIDHWFLTNFSWKWSKSGFSCRNGSDLRENNNKTF